MIMNYNNLTERSNYSNIVLDGVFKIDKNKLF